VLVGAFGGLRFGELAGLRWRRVDLDAGTVEVAEIVGGSRGQAKGAPLRLNGFRHRFWSKAVKAAGLAGFRIHDLRHTAVSLWIAAGTNPKIVAARAGHTSVSFTLDRYGHLFPEADEQLRRQLDRLIRKTAPRRPRGQKPAGGDSPA
jgi:integrase